MTSLPIIQIYEYHLDVEHNMVHPPVIEDDLVLAAHEASCRRVNTFLQHTQIQKRSPLSRNEPLSLSWNDVSIDRILGVGGSASVSSVRVPKLDKQFNNQLPPKKQSTRWYALKCLHQNSINDSKRFVRDSSGLAMEATLLSRLNHENIIQLFGETIRSKETFRQPGGYFLVLQCMKQTLDGLVRTWTSSSEKSRTVPSVSQRSRDYGVGITNAMAYLHSKRILFRDLKPSNVGIDYDGKVRLFDFGLAEELPLDQDYIEGRCAGTLRYLAPEVFIDRRASFSSDVYSLGVLLWHLSTLQKPYAAEELKTPKDFRKQVGRNNMRPSITNLNGNENIAGKQQNAIMLDLIQQCWHPCPEKRPMFAQVQGLLQLYLKKEQRATTSKPATLRRLPILGKVLEKRRNRLRVMEVATLV